MTETNDYWDLLLAERFGRAIVGITMPSPQQSWRLSCGPDRYGAALLAAARWADRYGAQVSICLSDAIFDNPDATILAKTCQKLGLIETKMQPAPSSLEIVDGEEITKYAALPEFPCIWDLPLDNEASRFFARLADAADPVLSCAESRDIDQKTMLDYSLPGLCLMENAGVGATMIAVDMLKKTPNSGTICVVCGGGNNAGDGFVVARGLHLLGYDVVVVTLKDPAALAGDAAVNYAYLTRMPRMRKYDLSAQPQNIRHHLDNCILVVDALLGTGFTGAVADKYRTAIDILNVSGIQILSLDIPSGLSGDTGLADQSTVRAARTAAFAAVKKGLLVEAGPEKCGLIYTVEIGAPRPVLSRSAW